MISVGVIGTSLQNWEMVQETSERELYSNNTKLEIYGSRKKKNITLKARKAGMLHSHFKHCVFKTS